MALGSFLHVINEFGSTKPTLLSFDLTVGRSPTNLAAEKLEITLRSLPHKLRDLKKCIFWKISHAE